MFDTENMKMNKTHCCPLRNEFLAGRTRAPGTVMNKAGAFTNGSPGQVSPRTEWSVPPAGGVTADHALDQPRVLKDTSQLSEVLERVGGHAPLSN